MSGKKRNRPPVGNSSGTVFVERAIGEGRPVAILWVRNHEGVYVGFMHALEDAPSKRESTARAETTAHVNGMGIIDADTNAFSKLQLETSVWETMTYAQAVERFGSKPAADGMFMDEGGIVGDNALVFGCDCDIESDEAKRYHAKERRQALIAALITIAIYAAAFALTYAMALSGGGQGDTVGAGLAAIWTTVLIFAGVAMLIDLGARLSRFVYKRIALS